MVPVYPTGTAPCPPGAYPTGSGVPPNMPMPSKPITPYVGAANALNAAGVLAGFGAVLAFFL